MKLALKTIMMLALLVISHFAHSVSPDSVPTQIRVGVLVSGSVDWEISSLKLNQFDKLNNIDVQVKRLGSVSALLVALQGGAVDVIVSDWIWVANQHAQSRYYRFSPFSTLAGAIMVPRAKKITGIEQLKDRTLAIAGGPEGKSWLLLNAYVKQKFDIDLGSFTVPKFVAPPLANVLLIQGKCDATLNFWHFNAALNSDEYEPLISVREILRGIGIKSDIPMLGWVFSDKLAKSNPSLVESFLRASQQTKQHLKTSDKAWLPLKKLMRVSRDNHFFSLRDSFRRGIPETFGEREKVDISKAYQIVVEQDSTIDRLSKIGPSRFPDEIFW